MRLLARLVLFLALPLIGSASPRRGLFVGCGFHGNQIELFHTWTGTASLRRVGGTWVGAWNASHHFEVGRTMRDRIGMQYGPVRGATRFLSHRCRRRIADRYHRAGARYRVPASLIRGAGRCPKGVDPARLPWGPWVPVLCLELTEPVEYEVWGPNGEPRPAFGDRIPLLADEEHGKWPSELLLP